MPLRFRPGHASAKVAVGLIPVSSVLLYDLFCVPGPLRQYHGGHGRAVTAERAGVMGL